MVLALSRTWLCFLAICVAYKSACSPAPPVVKLPLLECITCTACSIEHFESDWLLMALKILFGGSMITLDIITILLIYMITNILLCSYLDPDLPAGGAQVLCVGQSTETRSALTSAQLPACARSAGSWTRGIWAAW